MVRGQSVICIDFDGTCVLHRFPEVGPINMGSTHWLRKFVKDGAKLVLFTMRGGFHLAEAAAWFDEFKIPLYGINENPTQRDWTDSPKAYGQLYIDDAALGAPLWTPAKGERQALDWTIAGPMAMKWLDDHRRTWKP